MILIPLYSILGIYSRCVNESTVADATGVHILPILVMIQRYRVNAKAEKVKVRVKVKPIAGESMDKEPPNLKKLVMSR